MSNSKVRAWFEARVIPTYLPGPPDKNPMFLFGRVYQGSSGKVYPLPFTDSISNEPVEREWQTAVIENDYLRVVVLLELGGRIHELYDKSNGYECIYHQKVIKPALVGLAGPWISGGIEFNWPQHHRPATFLPVQCEIESGDDGSKTIWCSDHDPLTRMKGMHGICLYEDKSCLELKVRVFNRTSLVETFLWWANAGVRVHEGYQSFFPPDVQFVADHARRAISSFPLCDDHYYGVDYGSRESEGVKREELPRKFVPPHLASVSRFRTGSGSDRPDVFAGDSEASGPVADAPGSENYKPNDLSWYANIPTPCSYMVIDSKGDFFGGYDHKVGAGIIHVADHHIAPGKKQWTWGNHDFGYAWDRQLSDDSAPYVELMAGVFTDNQPDFSFLLPGETRSWSQFWYPIQQIGVPTNANTEAAVSLKIVKRKLHLGINVNSDFSNARIRLTKGNGDSLEVRVDLKVGSPFVDQFDWSGSQATLQIFDNEDREIISAEVSTKRKRKDPPKAATEPPKPEQIESNEELYLVGLHLEQYRHATRSSLPYWQAALDRDPLDSRCNNAVGLWHLRRGEFEIAETYFRRSIERLTRRNANPRDGECFYNLGECLRLQSFKSCEEEKLEEAYSAFFKATWNKEWAASAYVALAEIDCCRTEFDLALDHINTALDLDPNNLKCWNLRTIILHKLEFEDLSVESKARTLRLDPLDACGRYLAKGILAGDLQTALDVSHDFIRGGFLGEAEGLLLDHLQHSWAETDLPTQSWGALPLVWYTLGWIQERLQKNDESHASYQRGSATPTDYCFPYRVEEIAILEAASKADPADARPYYYLGNLFYSKERQSEAVTCWRKSVRLDPSCSVVWRNLGIADFNFAAKPALAQRDYEQAFKANPNDARVLFELDQLAKRRRELPGKRLGRLSKSMGLVLQRDDLTVELCRLYNLLDQPERAREILITREFKPWEGGEGLALSQFVRSHLAIGRNHLLGGDFEVALSSFQSALSPPENLGETFHPLANKSDIYFWIGVAFSLLGRKKEARQRWTTGATFEGDFQEMSVRQFSEMTFYSALSHMCLNRQARARNLAERVIEFATKLDKSTAEVDYFATSLPDMLVFDDDLDRRKKVLSLFLKAQANYIKGRKGIARRLVTQVLELNPAHEMANSFLAEVATLKSVIK